MRDGNSPGEISSLVGYSEKAALSSVFKSAGYKIVKTVVKK